MMKGKNQASQNVKKLAMAEQRIADLERELSDTVGAAHRSEQELASQIQVLRGRLVSEVALLAADKIAAAKSEAERLVKDADEARVESVVRAFRYISENGEVKLAIPAWAMVASILDVPVGAFVTSSAEQRFNRYARRANKAHANGVARLAEWKGPRK